MHFKIKFCTCIFISFISRSIKFNGLLYSFNDYCLRMAHLCVCIYK